MKKVTAESARTIAVGLVQAMNLMSHHDPLEALHKFPWNIPENGSVDRWTEANFSLVLDGRSCLGRIAQAAALVELQFPRVLVGYAEVLSDHLRNDMLDQIDKSLPQDETLQIGQLQEILLYEEPHAVIMVDGEQFDPLSMVCPVKLNHITGQSFPVWNAIASAMTVATAWLEQDLSIKLQILEEAESLCPGTVLVAENKVGALIRLDRYDESTNLLKEVVVRRPTARALYALFLSTGYSEYKDQIDRDYAPLMFEVLQYEGGS